MHNQLNLNMQSKKGENSIFIFYFNCIHFTFFYSKINSISINILIFYRNTLSTLLRSSIMKISSFYYEYKMICKKSYYKNYLKLFLIDWYFKRELCQEDFKRLLLDKKMNCLIELFWLDGMDYWITGFGVLDFTNTESDN